MSLFICQFCGRETTNAGANKRHEKACEKNSNRSKTEYKSSYLPVLAVEDHLCSYGCGKEAKYSNKNGSYVCDSHASKCPANKKKNSLGAKKAYSTGKRKSAKIQYENLSQDKKDKMAWSRGLTKEDHPSIEKQALFLSEYQRGRKRKPHSEETKRLMSIRRIDFLENNSKWCEWFEVNGIKVQGTLERQFAEFLVENEIPFLRKRLIYQGHRRYTPDFYLPNQDIFVEIKGFLFEKDKAKMYSVLQEHSIDLRLAFKEDLERLNSMTDILRLPLAIDVILKDGIDISKFKNHWGVEGN